MASRNPAAKVDGDLVIEYVDPASLTPDPDNARKHGDRNMAAIKESLRQFGQVKPIVVSKAGVIAAGNGTHAAVVDLGWSRIAIVRLPWDDLDKCKAYALADNRTAELATWHNDVLMKSLDDLADTGWDMAALGFGKRGEPGHDGDDDTTPHLSAAGYAVIVECDDEAMQAEVMERLEADGLTVRPLIT